MNEPRIIHETTDYIVLDKPTGWLTHPTMAHEPKTVVSWILERYPEIATVGEQTDLRPGIVHRLDKDTSGVLVVARTQAMYDHLKRQFQERLTNKEYSALVYGQPSEDHGIIDLPIARSTDGTMSGTRDPDDKRATREAKTEWWIEKLFSGVTLLRVKIYTGRTHQIRAHLKAIGHPLVGDPLYRAKLRWKKNVPPPPRLCLHARELSFTDLAGARQTFTSELPFELTEYLTKLKSSSPT